MVVVAASGLLFGLFASGADVVLPLWVSRELGYSAADWAHLRSLRMAGVLVGVIFLGALSDRFGERLLGALSMFGTAAILVVLGLWKGAGLWVVMPLYGALVSTAFVNLNTLTQMVSDQRQGLANVIYRSTGAIAGVAAPIAATALAAAWGGYPVVLLVLAVLLTAAAIALLRYEVLSVPAPLRGLGAEIRESVTSYRAALRERKLMWMIHLSQIWGNVLTGVGTFAAIRFTQELGQTDEQFGAVCAVAGVAALLATVATGLILDRVSLRRFCAVWAVVCGGCAALMGATDSLALSIVGFVAYAPFMSVLIAPTSMWVSRAAESCTRAAAFTVHKVISAGHVAAAVWAAGLLEPILGMRGVIFWGGVLGVLFGGLFLVLPEPPRPVGAVELPGTDVAPAEAPIRA
jgi:DHA1 family bicyclomycin/chloramphenicol resistance-like MFS transporter